MNRSTRDKQIDNFVCKKAYYGKTYWDEKASYDNTADPVIQVPAKPEKEIITIYEIRSLVMRRAHELRKSCSFMNWSNCQGIAWQEIKAMYSWKE